MWRLSEWNFGQVGKPPVSWFANFAPCHFRQTFFQSKFWFSFKVMKTRNYEKLSTKFLIIWKKTLLCARAISCSLTHNALIGRAMGGWLSQLPHAHNCIFWISECKFPAAILKTDNNTLVISFTQKTMSLDASFWLEYFWHHFFMKRKLNREKWNRRVLTSKNYLN